MNKKEERTVVNKNLLEGENIPSKSEWLTNNILNFEYFNKYYYFVYVTFFVCVIFLPIANFSVVIAMKKDQQFIEGWV